MSSTSLMRLLNQARDGDAESLGLLLRNYFRYLNTLSLGHLDERIRMRVSASDIVQDTLLEAHRDFQKFVGTSVQEFTGWLRKILFNNLARAIESHLIAGKRDVRKQRSLDEQVSGSSELSPPFDMGLQGNNTSPSSVVCRDETLQTLTSAINLLPDDYRQVIHLRHVEGLSFPEIALRLGRNHGATRMLWFRAVEKLKEAMTSEN